MAEIVNDVVIGTPLRGDRAIWSPPGHAKLAFDFLAVSGNRLLYPASIFLRHVFGYISVAGTYAGHAFAMCVTLLALSAAALAGSMDDAHHPEVFAPRFVAAVISKSIDHRKSIIHPGTLACMNPQTQPYFDWIFSKQFRIVTNSKPTVTVTPIARVPVVMPTDGHSDYPVRPTHQIQIDFVTDPYKSSSVVLFVAHDGVQWREILPCPREDVIAQSRANQIAEQKEATRAQGLRDGMPGALRTEILGLLRDGRKVEAIRRHAAATGTDLSTSKSVIELLATGQTSK